MRDFNFFSEYIFTSKKISIKKFVTPVVFLVLIGGLVGLYFYMNLHIKDLQAEYDAQREVIESQMFKDALEEVESLRLVSTDLRMIGEDIVLFDHIISNSYVVTDDLMQLVLESTPRNVVFQSYAIGESGITISALSSDYAFISEFESNLRNLGIFTSTHVENIASNETGDLQFAFNIQLGFGGDDID